MEANRAERVYGMLVEPLEDEIIRIVARIVAEPHAAEDVLQDVLATIWQNMRRIERHSNPHAYVLRVCLSRSVDHLRKHARRRETLLAIDLEHPGTGPSESLIEQETAEIVRRTIGRIPRKQAQAVLLRALGDRSYADIAEVLGCSSDTARSHFSKGIARVRSILNKSGNGHHSGDSR